MINPLLLEEMKLLNDSDLLDLLDIVSDEVKRRNSISPSSGDGAVDSDVLRRATEEFSSMLARALAGGEKAHK